VEVGAPVELRLPAGATGMRVTRPDGQVVELAPGASGAGSVTFVATDVLGIYMAQPILPAPSPSPSGSPGATATPLPSGTVAPSPSAGSGTSGDGTITFAVDLFDLDESNIAPGDGARIAAVGVERSATGAPAGIARDEWWVPLALLALLLLVLEWLVYERDGARRIWQAARRLLWVRPTRPRGAA
jgi:hypothetical protein